MPVNLEPRCDLLNQPAPICNHCSLCPLCPRSWGPMAQLTYWSLQQYDHVPVVRSGRKALCKQMTALMRSQWNEHRHICENYSPHKDASSPKSKGDCSGTKFYHWGALTGMISLIEDGYY